jgi:hypothetical protein
MNIITIITIILTIVITIIAISLPSIYEVSHYSKIYDLFTILANDDPEMRKLSKSNNIVTNYFPASNLKITANVTYSINIETSVITINIDNLLYSFNINDPKTKQIILPILLSRK